MNIYLNQVNSDVWKFERERPQERRRRGMSAAQGSTHPQLQGGASPRGRAGLPPPYGKPGPRLSPQLSCLLGGGTPRLGPHPRPRLSSTPHNTGACETGHACQCSSSHGQAPSLVSRHVMLLIRPTESGRRN